MILNDDVDTPYEGIKFESIFNQLQFFHVCNPGLPPCLGHDLFEGVVAYDLPVFMKYFIQENHGSHMSILIIEFLLSIIMGQMPEINQTK